MSACLTDNCDNTKGPEKRSNSINTIIKVTNKHYHHQGNQQNQLVQTYNGNYNILFDFQLHVISYNSVHLSLKTLIYCLVLNDLPMFIFYYFPDFAQ